MITIRPDDIVEEGVTAWDLAMRPCRTREELQDWLITFLDMDLPDTIVDPASNCTPLDMAWKVYSNCLWWHEMPPEKRESKMLFYAARESFKTYGAAAVEFMVALHDKRGVVHSAAGQIHAKKAYDDYFKSRILDTPFFTQFRDRLKKNTASECVFPGGTKIVIIPVTAKATQGQHESLLCRDEIDVVQDLRAYKDLSGIPIGMPDKRPPIDFGISVRKSAFGLVQREIEAAERGETDTRVYHWNIIDCTERCGDERSGTNPITLYVRNNSMHYVDQAGYDRLDGGERQSYQAFPALGSTPAEAAAAKAANKPEPGCATNCKLFAACLTNLKRQESTCSWLKPIDHAQSKMRESSEEFFIASYLSQRPPSEGLVYTRFDQKNIKTYKEMYHIFCGEEWPRDHMSLDEFIDVMRQNRVPCVAGVDWGFTHPSACVVIYIDKSDNLYVVYCLSRTKVDDAEFVRMIATEIQPRFNVQLYFPDTENPSAIKMMIKRDLPVSKKVDKSKGSVYNGVQVMKSFITTPGTNTGKFFVAKEERSGCSFVIWEFGKYHHETDAGGTIDDTKFADEDDHSLDAIRYPVNTIYGKSQVHLTVASSEDKRMGPDGKLKPEEMPVKDGDGNFTRVPSAAELAAHMGNVGFHDNREDLQRKKDEEEDPNGTDKGSGGVGGSFSWSF